MGVTVSKKKLDSEDEDKKDGEEDLEDSGTGLLNTELTLAMTVVKIRRRHIVGSFFLLECVKF